MTLHLPSILIGFGLAYWISGVVLSIMYALDRRQARQATLAKTGRDVDQLLADVAVQCIERPTDVRTN